MVAFFIATSLYIDMYFIITQTAVFFTLEHFFMTALRTTNPHLQSESDFAYYIKYNSSSIQFKRLLKRN